MISALELLTAARHSPGAPLTSGETIYAYSAPPDQRAGFIEHVWMRDGAEVARHYIPLGTDRPWPTWSRHRLRAGEYTVAVLAQDGRRLAERTFTAVSRARRARPRRRWPRH